MGKSMDCQQLAAKTCKSFMKRGAGAFAALALLVAMQAAPAAAQSGADAFAGTWDTFTNIPPFTHFDLTLTRVGQTHLTGSYHTLPTDPMGHLEGNVDASGTHLNYFWSVGQLTGSGSFDLFGNQIAGTWMTAGPSPVGGTWNGTRKSAGLGGGISISGGGITLKIPPLGGGTSGGGVTLSLGDTGAAPSAGAGQPPANLPIARITSGASVHSTASKNSPIVATLGAGSMVAYEPACPGGSCKVYWNGGSGFVPSQLLDFSPVGGGGGVSPPPGTGAGTPGSNTFTGTWKVQLIPDGGSPFEYYLQINQAGSKATAKVNSTPQVNLQCTASGAQLSCSWNTSGIAYSGNFSRAGNQISGNWQSNKSVPMTGSWAGTRM